MRGEDDLRGLATLHIAKPGLFWAEKETWTYRRLLLILMQVLKWQPTD